MPLTRVSKINPGGGQSANEFDGLDAEDKRIAAELEAKAQAGIPPGSDHPMKTSQHNAAVKVSKEKAKLDLLFGTARDDYLAERAARRAARLAAGKAGDSTDEEEAEPEGDAAPPPGADIPVDDNEIAWFMEHYRLGRWVNDDDAALAELRPIVDPTVALVELQVIYFANPSLKAAHDLERRDGVDQLLAEYHACLRNKKRPPKTTVATKVTPLLRRLNRRELATLEEEARILRSCEDHPEYSAPFVSLTWWALFVVVFFAYAYLGRGTETYFLKQGLLDAMDGFTGVTDAEGLFTFLEGDWLNATFPLTAGNVSLSCKRRQFMADGVNLRVGNPRIRQVGAA